MKSNSEADNNNAPQGSDLSELHDLAGHLIRRCHQIAVALFYAEFGEFDITPVQYSILSVLHSRPGIDQTQLAGLVALDRTTTGTTLARLEQKGWVTRKPCPTDKRVKLNYLTEDGKNLLQRMPPAGPKVSDRLLDGLSPAEKHLFIEILKKVVHIKNAESRAPLQEVL